MENARRNASKNALELPSNLLFAMIRGDSQASYPSSSSSLKPERYGVVTPLLPGDVSLAGDLEAQVVRQLAGRYKAWLYLNEGPHLQRTELEAQGVEVKVAVVPTPKQGKATKEHAERVLEAMESLPRPLRLGSKR